MRIENIKTQSAAFFPFDWAFPQSAIRNPHSAIGTSAFRNHPECCYTAHAAGRLKMQLRAARARMMFVLGARVKNRRARSKAAERGRRSDREMSSWSRFKRSLKAMFGGLIEKTEDPELILQQTIREMRDRVPELNNSVANVMATERLLSKNKERLGQQVVDLDSKIKASIKMGRDDLATAYIGQLQQAQLDHQRTIQQLQTAEVASKQALKARDNYVIQMQRRTAEAMQLINQAKQAKLQEQLAQTMESFQLGDDASTFNEMRDKIDRRAAAAEAKMQLGAASVDAQMQDIEREALDMQLQDKLLEYKRGMGLLTGASSQQNALPPASDPSGGNGHS
jgi:phage shock protein A